MSMVFTGRPATATAWRRPGWPCACAASSSPQLQKATPAAALKMFLRVVMARLPPWLLCGEGWRGFVAGASANPCCVATCHSLHPHPRQRAASRRMIGAGETRSVTMYELFYWPTPNGKKVTILLEELGVPYRITPVNIGRGDQFTPEFLA